MRALALAALFTLIAVQPASAEITRIWLTHRTNEPTKVVDRQNVWLGAYRALFLFPEQVFNLASNLRKKM